MGDVHTIQIDIIFYGIMFFVFLILFMGICSCTTSSVKPTEAQTEFLLETYQCPNCSRGMESGYIIAQEGMLWSQTLPALPKGDAIFGEKYRVSYSFLPAHLCRQCGLIKIAQVKASE